MKLFGIDFEAKATNKQKVALVSVVSTAIVGTIVAPITTVVATIAGLTFRKEIEATFDEAKSFVQKHLVSYGMDFGKKTMVNKVKEFLNTKLF